jgi:hypothetical protein
VQYTLVARRLRAIASPIRDLAENLWAICCFRPAIHCPLKLDRVEPSYRFRDFLSYAAIGVNCGISSAVDEQTDTLGLQTTWMPRYAQPRIVPSDVSGLPTSFETLGSKDFDPAVLRSFATAYRSWIQEQAATLDPAQGTEDVESAERERRRFQEDLGRYEAEVERVSLGIHLLETSASNYQIDPACREAVPFRAWLMLNRTFQNAGKQKGIVSWRLFQMAFTLLRAERERCFDCCLRWLLNGVPAR